jgi:hypothetical protein
VTILSDFLTLFLGTTTSFTSSSTSIGFAAASGSMISSISSGFSGKRGGRGYSSSNFLSPLMYPPFLIAVASS